MSAPPSTEALLSFARSLTEEAGALAISRAGDLKVRYKADRSVVTDADLAVQRLIQGRLAQTFPTHGFVGEEAVGAPDPRRDADYVWIVDPIDGTDTFQRGLPAWAVSVGLLRGEEPVLGVMAIPATGEIYWALAGDRAWLDGEPIHVSPGDSLGSGSLTLVPSNLHRLARPITAGRIQGYGSTCFHLACVARGSAQATILGGSSVWDYFAATVILEAAGGALHSLHGQRLDIGPLARARTALPGSIACHPDRVGAVLDAFDVDLPAHLHGFTGSRRRGGF